MTSQTLYGMTSNRGAGYDGYGTVFSLTVPEPGTLAMLGAGALGLVGCAWRRRKAAYLRGLKTQTPNGG